MMGFKASFESVLPAIFFYYFRDIYASIRDLPKFYKIRQEYTEHSGFINFVSVLKTFFSPEETILFYPERPSDFHVVYKLCAIYGFKISMNPKKKTNNIFWSHNETYPDINDLDLIENNQKKIVNYRCNDVGKVKVGQLFYDIFGYSLDVNPLNYQGRMVEKSIMNGTNNANIVEGPLPPEKIQAGFVYQKEINNYSEINNFMLVYRVPVYANKIPLVYLKYRPYKNRFTGNYEKVEIKIPEQVFSQTEIEKILLMHKKIGADYGESDVLRDSDGRVYVVDINNNPGGPPRKMTHQQKIKAAKTISPFFKNLLKQLR